MIAFRLLIILVAVMMGCHLVAGCKRKPPDFDWQKIRRDKYVGEGYEEAMLSLKGRSEQEVVQRLGKPRTVTTLESGERLYYYPTADRGEEHMEVTLVLTFEEGECAEIGFGD